MQIDNFEQAQSLSDRLEATVPFSVRPGKQLLKILLDKRKNATSDDVFTVDWVKYSGDVGGISCALKDTIDNEVYIVSLTHLNINSEHPLAEEVVAYQLRRVQRLKLQDRGGFAADLLTNTSHQKRRKSSGFGFGK